MDSAPWSRAPLTDLRVNRLAEVATHAAKQLNLFRWQVGQDAELHLDRNAV